MLRTPTAPRSSLLRCTLPALLAVLAGGAFAAPALAQAHLPDHLQAQPHVHDESCAKGKSMRAMLAAGLSPGGLPQRRPVAFFPDNPASDGDFGDREASTATDLLNCKLEIELIPSSSTKNIVGKNTMSVKSLGNGLTQFTINLRSQYAITALKVDGLTATSTGPGTNSYARVITLPRVYNANEVFTVEINYEGLALSRGFGSIEFTTLGGNPGVFTLSEPYYSGTWWPVKDGDVFQPGDNGDKFTAQIWVTAPDTMTVASNGLLAGTDALTGARKRSRWETNYQTAPYLISIGATTYNTWTKVYNPASGGAMTCQFFVSPASDTLAQRTAWEKSITMMETYRTMGGSGGFGLYPFFNEKYGIYQFVFGGGMEHQTISGQGASTSESLTAHELGHQWWGDNVTCKTWSDIWLNEGFATYSECLWEQYKPGSTGLPAYFSAINARKPTTSSLAVYKFDTSSASAIFDSNTSYNKGAWVLHMLRHVVGDTKFWQILQAHRAAHQGGGATTDDFFGVAAGVAGSDLTYFKNQWVLGTALPVYQYGTQTVNLGGQNYLRLYLNQTQASVFTMPVDVRVTAGGTQNSVVVFNNAKSEWFLIPIPAAATATSIDPDGWILNGGKTSIAYIQGPAKVITASPALGATINFASAPALVTIGFSDNVTVAAADFTLTRNGSPVPFALTYNASTFVATLNAGTPLAGGSYVVTAKQTIKTVTGAIALDGEIANATSPASLPSGDGLANGNAVYNFTITGCPTDFDGDGFVTGEDFDAYVAAFELGNLSADFNFDGFVTGEDFDSFVATFEAGC